MTRHARCARRRWLPLAAVGVAVSVGVGAYLTSPDADLAPVTGLRQLDLLYLDQPAPGLHHLGVKPGRPAVIMFCDPACRRPDISAQVVQSSDPDLAARYALLTSSGRVGPGYALIDPHGRLRYRTFDPAPARHAEEIQILVDAVRAGR